MPIIFTTCYANLNIYVVLIIHTFSIYVRICIFYLTLPHNSITVSQFAWKLVVHIDSTNSSYVYATFYPCFSNENLLDYLPFCWEEWSCDIFLNIILHCCFFNGYTLKIILVAVIEYGKVIYFLKITYTFWWDILNIFLMEPF